MSRKGVIVMNPTLSCSLSILLLLASAFPAISNSQSTKWSENDERALLAKARKGDASAQMWLAAAYEQGWFGKVWFILTGSESNPNLSIARGHMTPEEIRHAEQLTAEWVRHHPNPAL